MEDNEPLWTAEEMNRKRGDTTLQLCGWCHFRGSGSYRYNCMISGSCNLLSSYHENRERKWNSTCIFKHLGKKDIASIIKSKEYEIQLAEAQIISLRDEIGSLEKLDIEDIPPLPSNRDCCHFNLKDRVAVFYNGKWNLGTVVPGYRHHDGCVSYVLDNYPESKKGWGCGYAVPCVMKEEEFLYFKSHKFNFHEWLKLSDRKYNGDPLPIDAYEKAI